MTAKAFSLRNPASDIREHLTGDEAIQFITDRAEVSRSTAQKAVQAAVDNQWFYGRRYHVVLEISSDERFTVVIR
jgi:hypothetical protein